MLNIMKIGCTAPKALSKIISGPFTQKGYLLFWSVKLYSEASQW